MAKIAEQAFMGEALSRIEIIDAHCHMGRNSQFSLPACGGDIQSLLADADRAGVNTLVISPHAAISNDYRYGNQKALEAVNAYPERVLGLVVLNGNFPEEMAKELKAFAAVPQFVGVKMHPDAHGAKVNGTGSMRAFELLEQLGGYVLLHTWQGSSFCDPSHCADALKAFPKLPFVLAHAAGTYEGVRQTAALMEKYDNAWADTSGSEYSMTGIETMLGMMDKTRVVYGSDMPYVDMYPPFARIALSKLEDACKQAIFAGNFKRLLTLNPKRAW